MKFIHFTDTHLLPSGSMLHKLDPETRFSSCIDSIIDQHSDAECCVLTGDLADRADPEVYELLVNQLSRLRMPCYSIIGNHDQRDLFRQYFPGTPVDSDGFIQYTVDTSAGVFVLLDTVKSGKHSGEYCERRREWLRETLAEHARKPVFLFMHHPPFNVHLPCIDRIGLVEQQAFAEVIQPHKNIRHLFFGHAHRPLSGNWLGISFSSLRGTNHQVGLDFKSTKIDYSDEPPDYSIVFVDSNQIVIHTHSYLL